MMLCVWGHLPPGYIRQYLSSDEPLSLADGRRWTVADLFDYLFWRGDLSFAEATKTLMELECTGSAFYKRFFTEQTKELLLVAGQTLRFGALRVSDCRLRRMHSST